MIKVEECPYCDGSGMQVVLGTGCEHGCCGNFLPTGECCGNAIPVEVQIEELIPCQWCYEHRKDDN